MNNRNIYRIHPSFRVVALANPPTRENAWCTPEVLSTFPFIDILSPLTIEEKSYIIKKLFPINETSSYLIQLHKQKVLEYLTNIHNEIDKLEKNSTTDIKLSASLSQSSLIPSCRQLLRVWKGCCESIESFHPKYDYQHDDLPLEIINDVKDRFKRMFMTSFMPLTLREAFDNALNRAQLPTKLDPSINIPIYHRILPKPDIVQIGDTYLPLFHPKKPELVPDTLFFDVPAHINYLQKIAHDILAGEKHILLIGNQG